MPQPQLNGILPCRTDAANNGEVKVEATVCFTVVPDPMVPHVKTVGSNVNISVNLRKREPLATTSGQSNKQVNGLSDPIPQTVLVEPL